MTGTRTVKVRDVSRIVVPSVLSKGGVIETGKREVDGAMRKAKRSLADCPWSFKRLRRTLLL